MRLEFPDIVRANRFGQSVVRPGGLRREAAEHPVPDDQNAAVVLVEVLLIPAVVHTVVRRRVEDVFDWPPELSDALGVNPVLVHQVQRETCEQARVRGLRYGEASAARV